LHECTTRIIIIENNKDIYSTYYSDDDTVILTGQNKTEESEDRAATPANKTGVDQGADE